MANAVVTTVRKPSINDEALGQFIAAELKTIFVVRNNQSIESLKRQYAVDNVVVATAAGPIIYTLSGKYYFYLSMAELRIKNISNGKNDHMVDAMGLVPGASVLDCTLGLGTDAVVVSYCVGDMGRVVGLEVSPLLALVAKLGLQNHISSSEQINKPMRRILVENCDYNLYLRNCEDKSFDIVYFDPMFRCPVSKSSSIKPVRCLADHQPLTSFAINEAKRVARKRVVIKETNGSSEFSKFGVDNIVGGKYSSVSYGIIYVGG